MEFPKVKIENILYATDLSENAQYAFSYAVSMANQYGARITLLNVLPEMPAIIDSSIAIGYIGEERWKTLEESHFQEAKDALISKRRDHHLVRSILDQFSEKANSDFGERVFESDEVVVEKGNPVEVILNVAKEKNCDLIVMGTHGIGTLADVVMGSTARRVIRRSTTPVLVVRIPEDNDYSPK
jgi:nucleotide-binding universal stress UspA family protein